MKNEDLTPSYVAGFIYNESPNLDSISGYEIGSAPGHKAIKVVHTGSYKHLGNAWSTAMGAKMTLKKRINKAIQGKFRNAEDLQEIVRRQAFKNWAPHFKHSMRKGVVGDWKNHFTREHGEMITEYLGDLMLYHRYIDDKNWWHALPA